MKALIFLLAISSLRACQANAQSADNDQCLFRLSFLGFAKDYCPTLDTLPMTDLQTGEIIGDTVIFGAMAENLGSFKLRAKDLDSIFNGRMEISFYDSSKNYSVDQFELNYYSGPSSSSKEVATIYCNDSVNKQAACLIRNAKRGEKFEVTNIYVSYEIEKGAYTDFHILPVHFTIELK